MKYLLSDGLRYSTAIAATTYHLQNVPKQDSTITFALYCLLFFCEQDYTSSSCCAIAYVYEYYYWMCNADDTDESN